MESRNLQKENENTQYVFNKNNFKINSTATQFYSFNKRNKIYAQISFDITLFGLEGFSSDKARRLVHTGN